MWSAVIATRDRVARKDLVSEWLTGDLIGEVRASVKTLQRGVDIGEILFDAVEIKSARFGDW